MLAPWVFLGALGVPAPAPAPAAYVVRLEGTAPPRFSVTATLPASARLAMDTTRPGDIPDLLEHGWPALVTGLRVVDANGREVETMADGAEGWRLPGNASGPLTATYAVDTQVLAEAGWPAPREAVFDDGQALSVVGRALFVAAEGTQESTVRFELPAGWRAWAPWDAAGKRHDASFHVRSVERLQQNLLVFSRSAPSIVAAAGFRLVVVPMGSWRALMSEVQQLLDKQVRHFVDLMEFRGKETYVVVLLPLFGGGGESYRQSLAVTYDSEPTLADRASWGNLLGHEVFHYWNGWGLSGADYASSQWFQEGFTEYAANLSTAAAGFMTPEEFRNKLAVHVANYRRLTTSLERPGTSKGPPLYSGGALVAFTWDVAIRQATGGERGFADFMRALWRRCESGAHRYIREDLIATLAEIVDGDWTAFLDAHVAGTEPLPLAETFALAGLRLIEPAGGKVEVVEDPGADARPPSIWRDIVRGK